MSPERERHIRWAQQSAADRLNAWMREGGELGTPAHKEFQLATKKLAWAMEPVMFGTELWFGRLGHGTKVHACMGSHALCGTASGTLRSGMMQAHSIDFHLTAADVTCEKCAEKAKRIEKRQGNRWSGIKPKVDYSVFFAGQTPDHGVVFGGYVHDGVTFGL